MSTEGYLGNEKLKRVGVEISFSEDESERDTQVFRRSNILY